MKSHADFFRGQLCASFGREKLGSTKLAEWIGSPSASLTAPITGGYPQVLQSLTSLKPLFAFEASRFASAALESYSTILGKWSGPEDRDGLAWRLIGLYYSAYYSAHAILRLSGISVTQIESWATIEKEFQTLYRSVPLTTLGLQRGYHVVKLDTSGTSMSISKAKVDSTHGSHTILWSEFKELADTGYSNSGLNTSSHQAALEAYSQKLATPLTMDDGSSCNWPWMPVIRNRINYRLPDQVWGPFAKRITPSANKQIHQLIVSPTSDLIADAATAELVWLRFSGSCVYLVSLLCHLLRDMEIRARSMSLLPFVFKERSQIISKLCAA